MRNLNAGKNVVSIQDGVSGDVHEIYYRMPSNKEIITYQVNLFERRGNKLLSRAFETRMKLGSQIITGFKKGSIGMDGVPFSSELSDPDYREDWKDLLVQYAPDVVASVALAAFEGTGVTSREAADDVPLDE